MATRKQRRRREKEKRHEYEIVYVDSEGNEVEADDADAKPRKRSDKEVRSQPRGRGRGVQPPSWRRTFRRGLIFAPIFLATVLLISPKTNTFVQNVAQTILLLAIFIPFSYFMDRVVWRSHQKRRAKGGG